MVSSKKPTLAIVSTYDELCGIAGYTKAIEPLLSDHFDVTVFDLDQFIFKHTSPSIQRLADKEITRICKSIALFDCVNIQLEHGTFGNAAKKIFKRLESVVRANKNVCVTFHTIMPSETFSFKDFFQAAFKHGITQAFNAYKTHKRADILGEGVYAMLKNEQRHRNLSIIVHTRRDARMLKIVNKLDNVYDHPLSYFKSEQVDAIYSKGISNRFSQLQSLPPDSILLGCFGFLSSYKGITTAIKAVSLLPENYHLAIFGGVHPSSIKKNQLIDPFVSELLNEIGAGRKLLESVKTSGINLNLGITRGDLTDIARQSHPSDLSSRIHFMGSLSDDDFPLAIASCDTVVLPYVEVGQSSSGPMSLAVDLRRHVLAGRTKAFMQYERYHKGRYKMFDVGNFLELSQLISSESVKSPALYPAPLFDGRSNKEVYLKALFQSS